MNNLKRNLLMSLMSTMTLVSFAQAQVTTESLDAEVDAEIEKMYQTQSPKKQTIVIPTVQKQPVTVIEASPLANSNAEAIRKNRQEEELRTESRIVEKLEQSRMEDEKRRADALFGDKFNSLNNKPAVSEVAPVVAPSSQIQPQPIIIQQAESIKEKDSLSRDDIRNEVRAALDEDKAVITEVSTNLLEKKYFSATAGIGQYPDSQLIRSNYSLGFGLGASSDYFAVEGGFIYSNYNMDAFYQSRYSAMTFYGPFVMNQYQLYLSAKYQILAGVIRPTVGGVMAYSYRTYVADFYNYSERLNQGDKFGDSNALDLGLSAGLDIVITQNFSVGADLKYMFNMTNTINGQTTPGSQSVEKMNYYTLGAVLKMGF